MTISEIFIYPIKSLSGISLQKVLVTDRGPQYDRRWMLVDRQNRFITQRKFPEMALLQPEIQGDELIISHKTKDILPLVVPLLPEENHVIHATVWEYSCITLSVSRYADAWLSEVLKTDCRLVYMPDESIIPVAEKHQRAGEVTSLSDGLPFLLVGQASLDHLNGLMEKPVPMDRFRTNFVFTGGKPYEEDGWKKIRIGEVIFYPVTRRGRCVLANVNQATGIRETEPFNTLTIHRNTGDKVIFGMGMIHEGGGSVQIGDKVEVI
ncbi:MAG: MOSC domain-containing protein [Bacteroidia bacterium]|nr:MOSC domain-containing protein [Bacteroidia bacterium]